MSELKKNVVDDSIETIEDSQNNIAVFPIEKIDTSWMTKAQKKFFEILKIEENRNKSYKELLKLAGYKHDSSWHNSINDERYASLLLSMGVQIRQRKSLPSHNEVIFIKDPKERELYLENDIWDLRVIFKKYPRHMNPGYYILNFTFIKNDYIKKIIKRYFKNMINTWSPSTFIAKLKNMKPFINSMHELYPNLSNFNCLTREGHIEKIISNMNCTNKKKSRCLRTIKQMFKYLYDNKWECGPETDALITSYDIPSNEQVLPRPIPPSIKIQLDNYIEKIIIPLLERKKNTPIVEPKYWDLLIVIRYTGRRFEDIAHLIAEHEDKSKECLQYDLDGDPMLYLDHRIAKIPKDLRIPLAHLKDSSGNNIVEQAILRQKRRVEKLPPVSDGYKYLFREIINYDENGFPIVDTITYKKFNDNYILPKIYKEIPLKFNNRIYKITSHQFRHTVATEMIDAGIDVYAVKEFLGHSSVAMTEKYIKVYQQRLKKVFKKNLSKSDATDIKNNLTEEEELYNNKWVKNKIIGVFELGDGCCEHPYKMPSCPHMACKTCVKKKIYPRHLQAVKDTIESETIHRDNAYRMGLTEKAEEFDKIVKFYSIALEIIKKGEVFVASKHFYGKGVQ